MTEDFLPPDYDVPGGSANYLKFRQGPPTVFRVLAPPIRGSLLWITRDGRDVPIRKREGIEFSAAELKSAQRGRDGKPSPPRHFWAMPVWNLERVQVLEIVQATIQRAIHSLTKNPKWGSPLRYDLVVERSDATGKTVYVTTPSPPEPMDAQAEQAWAELQLNGFDLSRLYDGGDPFGQRQTTATSSDPWDPETAPAFDVARDATGAVAPAAQQDLRENERKRFFALLRAALAVNAPGIVPAHVEDFQVGHLARVALLGRLLNTSTPEPLAMSVQEWREVNQALEKRVVAKAGAA